MVNKVDGIAGTVCYGLQVPGVDAALVLSDVLGIGILPKG